MLLSTTRIEKIPGLMDSNHPSFLIHHMDQLIERVTIYKLLGVQFDQNLNWAYHVDRICKSIYAKLYASVPEKLFVGKASRLLNELPKLTREEIDHKKFCVSLKNIFTKL